MSTYISDFFEGVTFIGNHSETVHELLDAQIDRLENARDEMPVCMRGVAVEYLTDLYISEVGLRPTEESLGRLSLFFASWSETQLEKTKSISPKRTDGLGKALNQGVDGQSYSLPFRKARIQTARD